MAGYPLTDFKERQWDGDATGEMYAGEVQFFVSLDLSRSGLPIGRHVERLSRPRKDYRRGKDYWPAMRFGPIEKLRNAVDLVVMPRVGEGQNLMHEIAEPGRFLRQVDLTRFKARALSFHPHDLVLLRLDADR